MRFKMTLSVQLIVRNGSSNILQSGYPVVEQMASTTHHGALKEIPAINHG